MKKTGDNYPGHPIRSCICGKRSKSYPLKAILWGVVLIILLGALIRLSTDSLGLLLSLGLSFTTLGIMAVYNIKKRHKIICSLRKAVLDFIITMPNNMPLGGF